MMKKERAAYVADSLEQLYPTPPIPLDHVDSFTLLIAVLLSAQTTDKKVNEVTPALFAAAPNPQAMAALPEATIKHYIREIGLSNTKAKHIKALAQILIDKHEGIVPDTFDALELLPGVGHKTASVVMSQAFGHPAFPVDTHIHRLMHRWKLSNGTTVEQTEKDAKRLFPKHRWNKLHIQIIYYGREYSPARGWSLEKDFITRTILENMKKSTQKD